LTVKKKKIPYIILENGLFGLKAFISLEYILLISFIGSLTASDVFRRDIISKQKGNKVNKRKGDLP